MITRTLPIRMILGCGETAIPGLLFLAEGEYGTVVVEQMFAGNAVGIMTFVDGPSELGQEFRSDPVYDGWKTVAIRLNRSRHGL